MIEHRSRIVEDETVYLSYANNDLQWMTESMRCSYECSYYEAKWSPSELSCISRMPLSKVCEKNEPL